MTQTALLVGMKKVLRVVVEEVPGWPIEVS
jgi:hypothetical protein